tara:strand:- start:1500 stop:1907 length:408 start_codon:yes stop_codon:yes gene_type:complete
MILEESPGYQILQKMGWETNTPLGIRGEGILRPVEMVDFRKGKDTRGLGFGSKEEKVLPNDGESRLAVVKVVSSCGGEYCVGKSIFGTAYVPGGAMRHLCNVAKCSKDHLIGKSFRVFLTARPGGRHPWRVVKVG